MKSECPFVSIVIPFYNRAEEVECCLASALAQRLPDGLAFEIIVVDNGSTDDTRARLSATVGVVLVDCATRGAAAARNAGWRAASGSLIAFMDSDCIAPEGWLAALVEPFKDTSVVATGGPIIAHRYDVAVTLYAHLGGVLNQELFFHGTHCFPPFFATANAAVRREALEAIGGFDEALMVCEDADLFWRILDPGYVDDQPLGGSWIPRQVGGKPCSGGALEFVEGAVMRHAYRETYEEFFRQARQYGASAAHVFAKHRGRFGVLHCVEWSHAPRLAILPLVIFWFLIYGERRVDWMRPLLELIWRAGISLGRIEGSLRHRVVFL